MPEVRVVGIGVSPSETGAVLVLQEIAGLGRYVPVSIGRPEAEAIVLGYERVVTLRPLTHQLILAVLRALGHQVERARITELRGGVFRAELGVTGGTVVSARTSDAVALALHAGVGIWAEDTVLDAAGVAGVEWVLDEDVAGSGPDAGGGMRPDEEEVSKFRRFLNSIFPEDFDPS
ncbi:bifunctional nuclease family protein [Pseudonocardia bannensis]|uniref:Bifunctional nuclease family protein n=1 Tax=Pseudonocardia bannensis TaxID=630973 RepID=A0A848DHA6_9PSEU|nr:bifunctional nuclease family protein [Pseudonocardia bannensis]NMH92037.1 bifunctional nuclease family protein [Pseudonocardia bannensis]